MRLPPFVRSAYNYDMDAASDESGLKCEDATLAKQSFKDEVDINTIVDRFGIGVPMPEGVVVPGPGEFLEVTDLQSALNVVNQSREAFMQMPARLRARFGNDPGQFLEFFNDPGNRDEAVKLGLVVAPAPVVKPAPVEVVVVPTTSTPASAGS